MPILQVWERVMQQPVDSDVVSIQDLMRRPRPACAPFSNRLSFACAAICLRHWMCLPAAERVSAAGGTQLPALNDDRRAWALR